MKKKPWSGRFEKETDKLVEEFTASIPFDNRLYKQDIEGSIAHCSMLSKCNIIKKAEAKKIIEGLKEIQREIESGRFKFDISLEDIHMNIERRLIEKIGAVGGKLHTARSRNDQVALDIRLYLRDEVNEIIKLIGALKKSIVKKAKKNIGVIIPGYTHLQMAQPVLFSHHLLAYYDMFERDEERFTDVLKRVNIMPLGSAALSGTNYPIDRRYVAKLLGFADITTNSMDAVGDRDFSLEFLSASAILMMHLSRLSEELILWSTSEFGFIELDDSFCTGSSIMPQKKNPDVPELVRGKTGRIYGNLISLLTVMKSLPLAYNKDMQEDKEPVFDTVDTVKASLSIYSKMLDTMQLKRDRLKKMVEQGFMTATDMADYLAIKGIPFRDAHEVVGKVVSYCIKNNKLLSELTLSELQKFSVKFKKDIFDFINVEKSVNRKDVIGGTSKRQVLKRISEIEGQK
ncbi:MAG: argininosuccinate lyase, partial [Nitrospinae bacterium]|nr:argininosuccinate lyase [Nitrospinota bacterium]